MEMAGGVERVHLRRRRFHLLRNQADRRGEIKRTYCFRAGARGYNAATRTSLHF